MKYHLYNEFPGCRHFSICGFYSHLCAGFLLPSLLQVIPPALCILSFFPSTGLHYKTLFSRLSYWHALLTISSSVDTPKPHELTSFGLFCYVFVNAHASSNIYIPFSFQPLCTKTSSPESVSVDDGFIYLICLYLIHLPNIISRSLLLICISFLYVS